MYLYSVINVDATVQIFVPCCLGVIMDLMKQKTKGAFDGRLGFSVKFRLVKVRVCIVSMRILTSVEV